MTDAERLAKIREWVTGELRSPHIATPYDTGVIHGYGSAQESVLDILDAQPDPHPLGSVRFDEATEEQFVEFWGAAGFGANKWFWEGHLKQLRSSSDIGKGLLVEPNGLLSYATERMTIALPQHYSFATFQEALDALNELAGTKIMGGWA